MNLERSIYDLPWGNHAAVLRNRLDLAANPCARR
jgi:hypothetical protein